jgi:hypothetical protein
MVKDEPVLRTECCYNEFNDRLAKTQRRAEQSLAQVIEAIWSFH